MDRRTLLAALAALPFVRSFVESSPATWSSIDGIACTHYVIWCDEFTSYSDERSRLLQVDEVLRKHIAPEIRRAMNTETPLLAAFDLQRSLP